MFFEYLFLLENLLVMEPEGIRMTVKVLLERASRLHSLNQYEKAWELILQAEEILEGEI